MAYYKVPLIDLGYVDENGLPVSIAGRDNETDPFRHLGYVYPDGKRVDEVPGQYVVIESATPIDEAEVIAWSPRSKPAL